MSVSLAAGPSFLGRERTVVIGGIGLGLGYRSPVSTLIEWFPDRRGMAEETAPVVAARSEAQGSRAATPTAERTSAPALVVLAWAAVDLPLAAGVLITLQKAAILLH